MRVFVAGGAGEVGVRLVPQLVARGHQVVATTRSPGKVERLRELGAEPVVVDGLDAAAVGEAVARAEPDAIVHQMTALGGKINLRKFDQWFAVTNRLRTVGTQNLLAAAKATGVRKLVVQSYTGWSNIQSGGPVKTEADPFDPHPAKAQTETIAALRFLDEVVPAADGVEGIVLRYGNFYGPGASDSQLEVVRKRQFPIVGDGGGVWSWIQIEDAAAAAVAAVERGRRGVYNIVDDEPARVSEWLPYLAKVIGAKPPMRVPVWLGRLLAGEVVVRWLTQGRGASNEKAKRELGWQPTWSTWREGFRYALVADPAVRPSA
ncbi:MAG TPA: NAD(P)-dependent oxidoreductase [Natronosporangium sp.]